MCRPPGELPGKLSPSLRVSNQIAHKMPAKITLCNKVPEEERKHTKDNAKKVKEKWQKGKITPWDEMSGEEKKERKENEKNEREKVQKEKTKR